ncbi:Hypothetical protein A7982_10594 [Minicystis rosea]|nr:Hypothetical protein A7982_10594 [Minicystis rosea]
MPEPGDRCLRARVGINKAKRIDTVPTCARVARAACNPALR